MSHIIEAIRNGNFSTEELEEIQQELNAKSYTEFMATCRREGKSMEECAEEWKEKRGGGEQKAYGKPTKPYAASFINSILEILEKIGVSLTDDEKRRLKALVGKTTGETLFSVLPQGESGLRGLKVNMATGELYRPFSEAEIEESVREFMFSGMEHQREIELTKKRLRKNLAKATGENLRE